MVALPLDAYVVLTVINRLETLTEKRTGVVEMVKLAEKERNSLEVILLL